MTDENSLLIMCMMKNKQRDHIAHGIEFVLQWTGWKIHSIILTILSWARIKGLALHLIFMILSIMPIL